MEPCNKKIFRRGEPIAALDARAEAAEEWVKAVAKMANAKVDWHYSGGIAQVLYLGNSAGRKRVENAIDKLANSLDGRILRRIGQGETGLYRKGVSNVPKGAKAGFYDPGSGGQQFI